MSDEHAVSFTRGTPETVLPPLDPTLQEALDTVVRLSADQRRDALASLAGRHPRCIETWAGLAELTGDPVDRYAYARVGYHRGLDALRAAGWRGSGAVRWAQPTNRGFLRALDQLRRAAAEIGETDEEERCRIFLLQLDPAWDRTPPDLPG